MEKKIVPLRERLKYMVGVRFDSMKHMRNGVTVARGWYLFFGFYWFALVFFRKWPLDMMFRVVTGFSFSYKPNSEADEGALLWQENKKYLRCDYPEEANHAA